MALKVVAISLKEANCFVEEMHRHHTKVQGHKFSVGVSNNGKLCGVAIVGRPLSRFIDNGKTLEVTRLCTDGTKNACSFLYSRVARIAKEMGYEKIITYILEDESGTSLRASGWFCEEEECGGGTWNCKSRPREIVSSQLSLFPQKPKYPIGKKRRYAKYLQESEE